MIRSLPRWVEYGAFTLALLAGTVNAVGLMGFQHQSVSHLSGTATLLGASLLIQPADALWLAGVLISFLLGSAITGLAIASSSLKLGRHYDTLLMIEGALLLGAMLLLNGDKFWGMYLASMACGLQNALATTYSGAVVRTTHVTGIFTDLGLMLGGALRGVPVDRRKALLFGLIISGFVIGGLAGAILFGWWRFGALAVPAAVCVVLAILYRWHSRTQAGE